MKTRTKVKVKIEMVTILQNIGLGIKHAGKEGIALSDRDIPDVIRYRIGLPLWEIGKHISKFASDLFEKLPYETFYEGEFPDDDEE